MSKTFKTKNTALATAVMAGLLSCGVMASGFAAAVEGISYDGGTLTPGSDGTIAVSAIMTAGGISSYLLKSDFTEFKQVTGTDLVDIRKDMILLGGDMLHESDFNEYKSETAVTLGTMQTTVSSLSDLTAGFPEGKTIKNYVDDSITVVTGEISGLDGRMSAAESAIVNINTVTIPKITTDISDLQSGKLDKTDFNSYKTAVNGEISGLDGRMSAAEGAIDNINTVTIPKITTDISDLQSGKLDKTDFNSYKTAVNGEISSLDTRVSAAENGLVNAVNDISNLDTRVTQNETDLSALEGRVTTNEGNIATNKTNIKKLNNALYGDTLALGKGSKATGTNSIAIGFSNKVSGKNSGAFGDPNDVSGSGSYAFGNNNTVSGDNTFVLGNNIKTSAKNAVVLGDGSEGADNAVSVGAKGKERQIKHVADGTEDTDAATVGQLKALAGGTGAGLDEVTRRISNVDSKVNKVGAGAAALAALHPMDTDGKFSMAAGFGNYRDANAMALGLFYRPNDQVMFSMGGSLGNGENMINAGVSFALDKGVTTSKAAMARKIAAQDEKIASLEGQNAHQAAEIAALKEALARLEAKIGK